MSTAIESMSAHRRLLGLVAIVLVWMLVSGFYLMQEREHTGRLRGVPLDDSYIHFRYAQNLVHGRGLSFNPGEPSAGSTSPLWVMMLAGASLLTGEFLITSKVVGACSLLVTALVTRQIALKHTSSEQAGLVAAFVTLLSGRLVWTSLSGMETSVFTLATVLAISQWEINLKSFRSGLGVGVLFGLTALLRPEGWALFILAVVLQVVRFISERRPISPRAQVNKIAVQVSSYALVASTYVIFCLAVSGRPLPNTFYAKAGLWEKSALHVYLIWMTSLFALDNVLAFLVSALGVIVLLRRLWRERTLGVDAGLTLALTWLISLPLAYGLVAPYTTVYYFRYLVPLVPAGAVFCAVGAEQIRHLLQRSLPPRFRLVAPLIVIPLVIASWPGLRNWGDLYGRSVSDIQELHVAVGRWLGTHTDHGDRIATHDVGAIAYVSDRYVIDLAGLISPSVMPALSGRSPGAWDRPVLAELRHLNPDYVVVLEAWFPTWSSNADMVPIHSVSVDENAIAAGSRFVVYRSDL